VIDCWIGIDVSYRVDKKKPGDWEAGHIQFKSLIICRITQ
jgi:hypothetical protein